MPTVPVLAVVGVMLMAGQPIGIVKEPLPTQRFASVAVMVTVGLEEAVGVPVKLPSLAKDNPGGSVPAVTA